ncbi:MAG: DUF4264 family protein [Firmicutes bacterium]|nr:DUF4264 family protein [Bacillota bacterium]HOB22087.1 DUF4264 family protein [Bacillota bacterium]HQD39932.1 DUF4264 family protein [Bacillota bacterium]
MGHKIVSTWEVEETDGLALVLTSLVTFLNKQLKDRDLIFGLTRSEGKLEITIYEVEGTEEE